jgi:hypothetical protein
MEIDLSVQLATLKQAFTSLTPKITMAGSDISITQGNKTYTIPTTKVTSIKSGHTR